MWKTGSDPNGDEQTEKNLELTDSGTELVADDRSERRERRLELTAV